MGEARGSSHFVSECQKHLICYLLSFKGLRHSHVMEQLTRLPGASGALDLLHLLLKTGGAGVRVQTAGFLQRRRCCSDFIFIF